MLIHSPKEAPTHKENLKFTHSKNASLVKVNLDESHVYDKINKLKSYYKSAQSLIANQLSRKAHRSRADNENFAKLSSVLSKNFSTKNQFKEGLDNSFSSYKDERNCPPKNKIKNQDINFQTRDKIQISIKSLNQGNDQILKLPELPAIVETKSTHRTETQKIPTKSPADLKTILKKRLKNKSIQHKSLIDIYFAHPDKRLISQINELKSE